MPGHTVNGFAASLANDHCMKLLAAARYYYYGDSNGIEPQFYYLAKVPQTMGYEVDYFDFYYHAGFDLEGARRMFRNLVKSGGYDAVFVATNREEFDQETIETAKRHAPVIAWNSDDEFKWAAVSGPKAHWYSFMVTNSPDVFERNRATVSNLLHAQWACTGFWDGRETPKDIDFSFVGQAFGKRFAQIQQLRRRVGLVAYGRGTGNILIEGSAGLKQLAWRLLPQKLLPYEVVEHLSTIDFETVNRLWNRTRVSFTPLDSHDGTVRQIKSRVFDMGLSGTLMLSHQAPRLNDYYEPDKEYVPFDSLEECADKARFYLQHEAERRRIAEAYARRTRAEHLWKHRIEKIFTETGLIK